MAAVFIFGFFIGVFFAHFPLIVKYPNVNKISSNLFLDKYPDLAWSIYFLKSVPLIWVLIYILLFFIVPQMTLIQDIQVKIFIMAFWFIGGIGFIDAIFEVLTYISPHRYVSTSRGGGRRTGVDNVALGDSVGKFGWIRIGLMVAIGIGLPVGIEFLNRAFSK
ncbi:MAG: hypothetical protein GY805_07445 [Chloroflexi bacterium]|nr:hypothetical protein [Chloroflexota bacterium]